jgi:micrococcal nuclease
MNKKIITIILFVFFISMNNAYALEGKADVKLSNCVDSTSARFILNNEEIKIKFIGIDVGEFIITDEFDETNGKTVEEYVCSILKDAKNIKIEYDPKIEEKDKFGRVNAWVFLDDVLMQEHLVSIGAAKVAYLYDDYLYNDQLNEAEKNAKENKIGIWKEKEEDRIIIEPTQKEEKEKGFFEGILDFFKNIFSSIVEAFNDMVEDIIE